MTKSLNNKLLYMYGVFTILPLMVQKNTLKRYIGKRFSRLVVESYSHTLKTKAFWNCICDCGNKLVVLGQSLIDENTRSCGCLLKEYRNVTMRKRVLDMASNLIGIKHERLMPIEVCGVNDNQKVTIKCRCDCGNYTTVLATHLRQGEVRSCGCLASDLAKINVKFANLAYRNLHRIKRTPFELVFRGYQLSARNRNLLFELTEDECRTIMASNCHYCGSPPLNQYNRNAINGNNFIYNGMDRKDNRLGYTMENVVPSCVICNKAKAGMSVGYFKSWLTKAYLHLNDQHGQK